MSDAYVISSARTPIGKFLGAFRTQPAPTLGAAVVPEVLERAKLTGDDVDEVILGNVISAGVGQAPARQAALAAGLPASVAALTVNKVCGSGLKAVMLAAQAIRAGDAKIVVAGGMENMTLAPHLARGAGEGWKIGDVKLEDSMIADGLWCAFDDCHMGRHAEFTAKKYGITRDEQDRYAQTSQQRAGRAIADGDFHPEIVPVDISPKGNSISLTEDEGPRPNTSLEDLTRLRPAFDKAGSVTAGNASMLSDGAAAVVVVDHDTAIRSGAEFRARIVASYTSGGPPQELFVAPVLAIRGVLEKSGLNRSDIDLFEINEAFAVQMLACLRELDLDPVKVNVNGGAIALGHPIGASGARVLVTLLAALQARGLRRGLASLCLGGGNAVAMIVEREAD